MSICRLKKHISDFCESEKHRFPNFVPVGIGIGISFYFLLDKEPDFFLNALAFISLLVLSIFVKFDKRILYVFLTISFGFFVSQVRTKIVNTFMLSEKSSNSVPLTATIESCEKTEYGVKFIVNNVKSKAYESLKKIQLTWRCKKKLESYCPGTKVLFYAILYPIYPKMFPGEYDFRKQQYFREVSAKGFIVKQPRILEKPKKATFFLFVDQVRYCIDKEIEKYLANDTAAIAKALITGNKSGISKDVRNSFVKSGTAHLLAISGLHMGIIGFFVFLCFRVFLCCFPNVCMFYDVKKISAAISWIVTLIYLYISGNSIPSFRAFIMHTTIMLAILLERCSLTMRSVAIAATIIMVFSPESILFPSFQMSFSAVIAIVALYEKTWNFSGLRKLAFNAVAATLAASIPTSVFSLYNFNQLTLNSLPANIVLIPFMTFFVMPIILVTLFFMMFDMSYPFISLVGYAVKFLMKVSEFSSQLPGSNFVMQTPTTTNMAIFVLSGLILLMVHHKVRLLGIAGLAVSVIYYFFNSTPDIFISPKSKVIGIKTKNAACFNHLGYFRSSTSSWARSLGFETRERFDSEKCRQCISKISDNTYIANIKNQSIIITDRSEIYGSPTIHLDKNKDFAEIFYIPLKEVALNKLGARPWS